MFEADKINLNKILKFKKNLKKNILDMALHAGANSSHFGGALSILDIISVLYGFKMKIDKQNPMSENEISKIINNKQAIYDLKIDKKLNKIGDGSKLEKYELKNLPSYINNNIDKFKDWID